MLNNLASAIALHEPHALDTAIQAMNKKLGRSLQSRKRRDVLDGLVKQRMAVVFVPAVPTGPLPIALLDDAEEPSH